MNKLCRLVVVVVFVGLACDGVVGDVNRSQRVAESLNPKPSLASRDQEIGMADVLKAVLNFNSMKDTQPPAIERLFQGFNLASRLVPQLQGLEDSVNNAFDHVTSKTGQASGKGVLRQTLVAVVEEIPEPFRDSFLRQWHSALAQQPMLSLLLPLPSDVSNNTIPEEIQSESDTMWNILEEVVEALFPFSPDAADAAKALWNDLESVMENRKTEKVEPCTLLQYTEKTGLNLLDGVLASRTISDLRTAISQATDEMKSVPHVTPTDRMRCFTPDTPEHSSVIYFAKQAVALPFFQKLYDTDIKEDAIKLTANLITHIGEQVETEHTSGTIATAFLEVSTTTTTTTTTTTAKEKTDKAFSQGKALTPFVVLQVAVLAFCMFLHNNIHRNGSYMLNDIFSETSTNTSRLTSGIFYGRTLDEMTLTLGLGATIAFSIFQIVTILIVRSMKHKVAFQTMRLLASNVTAFESARKHKMHGEHVSKALQESDEEGQSRKVQLEAITECCEKEGMSEGFCPLYKAFVAGHDQHVTAIIEHLNAGLDMHGEATDVAQNAEQVAEQRLFNAFFNVQAGQVPTDIVAAKLIHLGLSDDVVEKTLAEADPKDSGAVNFKKFSSKFLHSDENGLVDGLREGKFMSRAFALIILAMLVLFSVGDHIHTWVGLGALLTWAIGSDIAVSIATTGRTMLPAMRQTRDVSFELGLQRIVRAVFVLLVFFLTYLFLMRTCEHPAVTCPNTPAVEASVAEMCKYKRHADPGIAVICSQLESETKICSEDVLSFDDSTCDTDVTCSYRNHVPFWDVKRLRELKRGSPLALYSLAHYNSEWSSINRILLTEDKFLSQQGLAIELNHRETPKVSPGCVEEPRPESVSNFQNIARGRNGMVENLLDFGAIEGEKHVAFVPFGGTCPTENPTTAKVGYFVTSRPIGKNQMDMAFFTHGSEQRRFHVTVPDREIGRNYYSLCEFNPTTTSWDISNNSVYIFGAPAFCSDPDCSNSDFADKMGPNAVDKLYFTIVTGTSVGFGDMSPASDQARLLIALHGVLMLVLGAL